MTQQDDVPVSQILSDCYRLIAEPDGLTPEQRDRMLAERCRPEHTAKIRERIPCYVAEADGRVVGFIASSDSHIEELFVDPAHHRRGAATALFREVESQCQGSVLTVDTTGYGIPFYQAMGMRITGRRTVTCGPLDGRELTQLAKETLKQPVGG